MAFAGQSLEHNPQLMHFSISNICLPRKPSATEAFTKGYFLVAGFLKIEENASFVICEDKALFFLAIYLHLYLSVHEKHGSKLTKFEGTSARFAPIAVLRKAGRFAKVGVRTLTRSGIAVPLLLT